MVDSADDEHSHLSNGKTEYSETSSISSAFDASIEDQTPQPIGRSSYWEYIFDLKSIKSRRPTPIVCQLQATSVAYDPYHFSYFIVS